MSVHLYQHIETIGGAQGGHAHILRTFSGKSFVVELYGPCGFIHTRRKRTRDAATREARRLLELLGL